MISRNERMKQVERYVSKAMSSEERAAFRARLERDTDLRRMVDAEEFVLHTLVQDRDAVPAEHDRTRARVLAVLASVGAAGAAASTAEAATAETTAVEMVRTAASQGAASQGTAAGAAIAGGTTLLTSLLIVVASGVVLTSAWFLAGRPFTDESVPQPVEQVEQPAQLPTSMPDAQLDQQTATPPIPAEERSTPEPTLRQARRTDARTGVSVEPAADAATRDTLRMKLQVTLPK